MSTDEREDINTLLSHSEEVRNNYDEDEDVILTNSPLDQYLQGLDPSETSMFPAKHSTSEQNNRAVSMNRARLNRFTYAFPMKTFFTRIEKFTLNYLFSRFFVRLFINKGTKLVLNSFSVIEQSKLLAEEDVLFIRTYKTLCHGAVCSSGFKFPSDIFTHVLLVACCAMVMDLKDYGELFCVLCGLLLAIWILTALAGMFLWMRFNRLSGNVHCLSRDTSGVFLLFKKGIRLIQEAELIARGFTTASVTNVVERIELSKTLPLNSSNRQYIELRKCVFSCMKDLFLSYKMQTKAIINNVTLCKLSELPSALAMLDIEEFGGLLNYDLNSPELLQVTDNFSISSLKTMHELVKMQVSEYFKYIISVTLFKYEGESGTLRIRFSNVKYMNSSIKSLLKTVRSTHQSVGETYCFYKSVEASYVSNREKSPHESQTAKSGLEVSVHNMSLHLKAALLRLLKVEEYLAAPTESVELMPAGIGALLKEVDGEIAAFQECSSLSNKIFNDIVSPKIETHDTVMVITEKDDNKDGSVPLIIKKCDMEPEIHDEVFEDVIEDIQFENDHYKAFQNDELKKNLEVSSNLMKELKNVLVIKADEHRTREEIALAKMAKGHSDPLSNLNAEPKISESQSYVPSNTSTDYSMSRVDNHLFRSVSPATKMSTDHNDPIGTVITTEKADEKLMDAACSYSENVIDESFTGADEKNLAFNEECADTEKDGSTYCAMILRAREDDFPKESSLPPPVKSELKTFGASIASLVAKRRELLGLPSEEVFGSESPDETSSDSD